MNLSDLAPDPNNANRGTERGNSALDASLQQYGAGRSRLVDKNNTIIAGNKTAEVAGQIGIENVRVIETAGDELVAVKRTALDLETDASAREMAYADNRVGELSLNWDARQLLKDADKISLNSFFYDTEIDDLTSGLELTPDLDDVSNKHGDEPGLESFWPEIRFKIPPAIYKLYKAKLDALPGDTEAQSFVELIKEVAAE